MSLFGRRPPAIPGDPGRDQVMVPARAVVELEYAVRLEHAADHVEQQLRAYAATPTPLRTRGLADTLLDLLLVLRPPAPATQDLREPSPIPQPAPTPPPPPTRTRWAPPRN